MKYQFTLKGVNVSSGAFNLVLEEISISSEMDAEEYTKLMDALMPIIKAIM